MMSGAQRSATAAFSASVSRALEPRKSAAPNSRNRAFSRSGTRSRCPAAFGSGSAIPIGSLAGGLFVDTTGDVSSLFLAVGAAMIVVPLAFAFTPVGRAARYEPAAASTAST